MSNHRRQKICAWTAAIRTAPAFLGAVFALNCSWLGTAQEWSRFRGPNGTGIGQGQHFPAQWTEGDYQWRIKLPGIGHSSPVLWGEKLFVTSADITHSQFTIICLNATDGSTAWQKGYALPHYTLHANNNFASATAAADARHLFVPRIDSGELVLTALTHDGELAWEFKAGPFKTEHGLGHSPIVYQNRVIFIDDQDLAGHVFALDADTGRVVWEVPRSPGRSDYSTPCVFEGQGRGAWLILNSHEDGISALNFKDGSQAWKDPRVLELRSVSSPVVANGLVIGSCGSGGGGNYVVALRPPAEAGMAPVLAYQIRRAAPYVPTPLVLGDLLFLWSDGGIVTCVEATTGVTVWQERVGGNYFSSPIFVDGKIYGTSTEGEVVVLEAGRTFKVLGRSSLDEPSHATPAVANGRMYFRSLSHVAALGPKR